jgi:phosphoribosylamine--glycine ligase
MKVLVIGSGGREHALVWKIAQSPLVKKIYCAPGNAGISEQAECVNIRAEDVKSLLDFALENKIDLAVVGPELALTLGIVDEFSKKGIKIFGPARYAARIEGSKVFAKEIMKRYGLPTSNFKTFTERDSAVDYLLEGGTPVVIKADGLAQGKGVVVAKSMNEARKAIDDIMVRKIFGEAGNTVVIEEFLEGEEVSIICITDGENYVLLPPCQDHKRVFDNDTGPNTGGMGAYSPVPIVTESVKNKIINRVVKPIINAFLKEGIVYKGALYAGLMIRKGNPYVLEFNCRFGDPETQPIMMRLKSDIVEIMLSALEGNLSKTRVECYENSAVCVVMASGGYPGEYKKGFEIKGLDEVRKMKDVVVFHAGTARQNGKIVTQGGRVLGVTGTGIDHDSAIKRTYSAVNMISWEGVHFRKDIGKKALKNN